MRPSTRPTPVRTHPPLSSRGQSARAGRPGANWTTNASRRQHERRDVPAEGAPPDRTVTRPAPRGVAAVRVGHGRGLRPTGRRTTESGPPAWARSMASLASAIRHRVLRAGHVTGGPAVEPGQRPASRGPQRDELGVLDPPAAGQLLDDQLRVEQQVDLAGAELPGQVERPDDARCTRRRCSSGRRGSRRSRRPGPPGGRGHRAAAGRTAPRRARRARGCRAPPRRSG